MLAIKRSPVLFAVLSCLACALGAQAASDGATRAPAPKRTPVIVELFSSEGCSSCPPADAYLKKLETQQPIPGVEVIALEEHVDYWNHDGWADPFSSVSWTYRQQEYVSKLRVSTEYTPEMVVDGESQTSGNDTTTAYALIVRAAQQPQVKVTLAAGKSDGKDAQDFSVSVGNLAAAGVRGDADVWLAVTEDGLHSSVSAGENAGRNLYHAAVLRSLKKIGVAKAHGDSPSFNGETRLKFNSHWNPANLRVVAFVQEKHSLKILGAAEIQR
jgi:hypothetical protein